MTTAPSSELDMELYYMRCCGIMHDHCTTKKLDVELYHMRCCGIMHDYCTIK